jgi:hypothetical protein
MIVAMNDEILGRLVDRIFLLGVSQGEIRSGKRPAYISKNKAYLQYGRASVDKWIKSGIVNVGQDIDPEKRRTIVRLSVIELEAAAVKCNILRDLSPNDESEIKALSTL